MRGPPHAGALVILVASRVLLAVLRTRAVLHRSGNTGSGAVPGPMATGDHLRHFIVGELHRSVGCHCRERHTSQSGQQQSLDLLTHLHLLLQTNTARNPNHSCLMEPSPHTIPHPTSISTSRDTVSLSVTLMFRRCRYWVIAPTFQVVSACCGSTPSSSGSFAWPITRPPCKIRRGADLNQRNRPRSRVCRPR